MLSCHVEPPPDAEHVIRLSPPAAITSVGLFTFSPVTRQSISHTMAYHAMSQQRYAEHMSHEELLFVYIADRRDERVEEAMDDTEVDQRRRGFSSVTYCSTKPPSQLPPAIWQR